MISINGIAPTIIYILVGGAIYGLLLMLINAVPDSVVPPPVKGWARVVLLVLVILVAIGFLLSLLPGGGTTPLFVR